MSWDRKNLESILPHRGPALLIDEVIQIDGTQRVIAVKHLKGNETFFQGHFPGRPIMPGVSIIEAMAQTSIILYYACKPEIAKTHPNYYLGKVRAEFLGPVYPGDELILEANNVKIIDEAGVVDAFAHVKDNLVAKANLVFGIKPVR